MTPFVLQMWVALILLGIGFGGLAYEVVRLTQRVRNLERALQAWTESGN